jgi:hypothetical protein
MRNASKSDASIAARVIKELSFWSRENASISRVTITVTHEPSDNEDDHSHHHDDGEQQQEALLRFIPMEDCIRFLERHPLIRQMIGDLIKEEEEQTKEIQNPETFERAVEQQHEHEETAGGAEMIPRMVSVSISEEESDANRDDEDDDGST